MAEPRYINVFLDTQFFDANQMDFANKTFGALRTCVAAGKIYVFSTDVTFREVAKHVSERAAKVCERLESVRKDTLIRNVTSPPFDTLHKQPSQEEIEAVMQKQLRDCWGDLRTNTLATDGVPVASILDDYFAQRPPFGAGKKKSEFPDAIAASALRDWCNSNQQKMHVVSGDGDWKAVCKVTSEFEYISELAELLSRYPDAAAAKSVREWVVASEDKVQPAIERAFRDYMLFKPQRQGEQLLTVDAKLIRAEDVYVIQLESGVATIEIPCKLSYSFRKLDNNMPAIEYLMTHGEPPYQFEGKGKSKAVAELTVRYDVNDPSVNAIESASISLRHAEKPTITF
ncbi:MAG: PIN domain-containing protein [Planctomycetes bacterium]|nr:PIN domain-containing protein [Planctomycetota bacterium]